MPRLIPAPKLPAEELRFSDRQLLALLAPLIAEQLLSYLVGLADSVMVSSAGGAAVSAVSMVDSISVLLLNAFSALATGGAVVVGQYWGHRDRKNSRLAARQLLVFLLMLSVGLTVLLELAQGPLLRLIYGRTDAAVLANCFAYYRIVMLSIPFIAVYNGAVALFRTLGDSTTPMRISLLMNAVNVGGNAWLIYGLRLGVIGVAIPTLVSRGVAAALICSLVLRPRFPLTVTPLRQYRYDGRMIRSILSIGVPNGIENSMFQLGKILLLSLVSTLPLAAITANAIGNTVGNFHVVVGVAVNSGMIPVVSQCVGAWDFSQARYYIRRLSVIIYWVQGLVCLVMILAIPLITRIYHAPQETAQLAAQVMLVHTVSSMLLWPTAFALNNGMRAAGDARFSMAVSIASMWLFRVGLSYVLVGVLQTGVIGVWLAWAVDFLFRSIVFVIRYRGHRWEHTPLTR